ncbi:MAG: hypothetical protein OXH54_05195, partial [Acidimicrobiaceae bacterium]|nr:hypothetical protein [Acidimicrobiaceae bacterium]
MNQFTVDAARSLPGPRWLAERRSAAAERFAAAEPPTTAAEEWRYSAIADLDLASYRLANGAATAGAPDRSGAGSDVIGIDGAPVTAVVDVVDG